MSNQLSTLVSDAEEELIGMQDTLDGVDSIDGLTTDQVMEIVDTLEVLAELADTVETALESIDLSELPESVDANKVIEAIQLGEIPAALEGDDAAEVVKLRGLLDAIDIVKLWHAADVATLWETARNVEDTLEDESDESMIDDAVDSMTGEDGIIGDGEMIDGNVSETIADEFDGPEIGGEGESFAIDDDQIQMYQEIIQQKALDGIEEFREALVLTHGKFAKIYEFNREHFGQTDKETHSRNPTAVSTIPLRPSTVGSTDRYSTVPQQVKHSTAPGFRRIYGDRFERELTRMRGDDE